MLKPFNWFRRKKETSAEDQNKQEQIIDSPPIETPEAEIESQTPTEAQKEPETTQEASLSWAKAAFKNIQIRKEQAKTEVIEEKLAETPEILAEEPEITQESLELPETEPSIQETVSEEENAPAWLKKSNRLEELKETALETPSLEEEVSLKLDEEFLWSAKVLAEQGRTPEEVSEGEINWLKRLRQGLGKTRQGLVNQLKAIVGQGPLNKAAVDEIEAILLQADVGVEATDQIIETLQTKLLEEALPPDQAIEYLKEIMREILDRPLKAFDSTEFVPQDDKFNIWLLTGVNGAGKTTTIGKLAHMAKESGYSCLIAAADTFRAAAVEQVKVWGERTNTPVIANPGQNTDPAAVVYDGIAAAQSRNVQLLLVDTAGRLQNKKNLMDELGKIRRIIDKKAPNAQVESLLVLDATLGQNGLRQAQVFLEVAKLSGVVLTKLDGTAKGGVALAVAQQLNLPIRFIGAGEGIEDLRPFSSYEFVEALLNG